MEIISLILLMLLFVVVSGYIVRILPWPIPLPLIQIALGVMISQFTGYEVTLNPEIFFVLFLPPLLFLDGWRIPKVSVIRDKTTILALALGLVIFTVLGMGYFIHWMIPSMPLAVSFALAAVLSPTDPVAVSAIASRVPIPKRIIHILEGESLLNDASGLVCLRFAIAAALTGVFSVSNAVLTFAWLSLGGIVIGIGVTLAIVLIKNWFSRRVGEESGTQILISLLIPFGAYMAAEHLGCSGILAAVAGGVTMSYAEISGQALATTRVRRNVVWDTVQFAANGVIFVLLGEQIPRIFRGAVKIVHDVGHHEAWWLALYVVAISLGLILLRFVWVWVLVRFTMSDVRRWRNMESHEWHLVALLSTAGVRGAITLAGILTLPLLMPDKSPFPARDLAIFLAAMAIIVSLTLVSVLLPYLIRTLRLPPEPVDKAAEDIARIAAAKAAMLAIENTQHDMSEGRGDIDVYVAAANRVMDMYRHEIDDALKTADEKELLRHVDELEKTFHLVALRASRDEVFRLARIGKLDHHIMHKIVREIDLAETRYSL
jgi:Na+/H+ antiporter